MRIYHDHEDFVARHSCRFGLRDKSRVHKGGAQTLYGIQPDLTTLGKVIGGGLPVGAYGGKKEIMQLVAPLGPMYQAAAEAAFRLDLDSIHALWQGFCPAKSGNGAR